MKGTFSLLKINTITSFTEKTLEHSDPVFLLVLFKLI